MSRDVLFSDSGIAAAIQQNRLLVPINQRSYKWEEKHVTDLFTDIDGALREQEEEYFLGTMVFIKRTDHELEIADGQQRLATIVILLAAFRDYLYSDATQKHFVESIRTNYLASFDPDMDTMRPHLVLNNEDNAYFQARIIADPHDPHRLNGAGNKPSHLLIHEAAEIAQKWVQDIVSTPDPAQKISRIKQWHKFLLNSAKVILVIVPDPGKAFKIFETLNDRGLKLSQVDLLKNHLYGLADNAKRLPEVQQRWDGMIGALESTGNEDFALDYIRQLWISYQGYIKEADLYKAIKGRTKSPNSAIEFAGDLSAQASTFVAILNPSHPLWRNHTDPTRRCIHILTNCLRADRIRPLLLSLVSTFGNKETEQALKLCISWTVRFLIVGGIGSGSIEQFYAEMACKVRNKTITTPQEIAVAMRKHVPADAEFREAFARRTLSRNYLARYYLRAIERQGHHEKNAALSIDDETERVDLEHVVPQKQSPEWPMDEELRLSLVNRIGNLCLWEKLPNSMHRSDGFDKKRPAYRESAYLLTQEIGHKATWGAKEIDERQTELAALAVKVWSIVV